SAFLVVGITGLLMFFHLFEGYTEEVHKVLGLFFVVCAISHIILNWKGLKFHFKKGIFLPSLFSVLAVSAILIITEIMYPPVDFQIMGRIVRAPVKQAFRANNYDYTKASEKLKNQGIYAEEARLFEDLLTETDSNAAARIDLHLEDREYDLIGTITLQYYY